MRISTCFVSIRCQFNCMMGKINGLDNVMNIRSTVRWAWQMRFSSTPNDCKICMAPTLGSHIPFNFHCPPEIVTEIIWSSRMVGDTIMSWWFSMIFISVASSDLFNHHPSGQRITLEFPKCNLCFIVTITIYAGLSISGTLTPSILRPHARMNAACTPVIALPKILICSLRSFGMKQSLHGTINTAHSIPVRKRTVWLIILLSIIFSACLTNNFNSTRDVSLMIFQVGESRSSCAHVGKVYIQRCDLKPRFCFNLMYWNLPAQRYWRSWVFFLIEPKEVFNGATHKTQQKFRGLDKTNPWAYRVKHCISPQK